jgi:O-antigen/teichoic acid export membrane protein
MAIYSAKKARRAMVDTVLFRAISQVATIIGFIVLVRAMPEEDFGVFNLLYAFIPVISTVASLGLEQTLRRYQPEYLSAGNTPAARWLVRFVASARFGTNVILLALILLTWNWVAPIFKLEPYRVEFAFFCLLVLLHFQARILQLSLAANMLHRFSVGSMAALGIAKLAAYGSFAAFDELTLPRAILADTIAYAICYGLLLAAYRKHCPAPDGPKFRPAPTEQKRLFRYGLFNNFNDAGTMVLSTKSDNFFIAAFLDPIAVGIYAFYNRLNEMLKHLQPLGLFDNVVQPLFFAVPPAEADEKIPRYFSLLLNTTLLLQLPVLVFSIAYHAELVAVVFGGKFGDYSVLFPMVVAFATLKIIATPVTLVAQYEEKAGIILLSKIFAAYNIVALLVLIPMAGIYGAVIATGSAALFKNLFIWWFARRRARWLKFGPMLFASSLTWTSTLGVCFLAKHALDLSHLFDLIVGLVVIGIGALVHVRTPALSASDRQILANVLRGKESRLFKIIGIIRPARIKP